MAVKLVLCLVREVSENHSGPFERVFITESQEVIEENKIINRSHSLLGKSRHKLKGI